MSDLALGTVVAAPDRDLGDGEIWCAVLDFYDHWSEVDPRLEAHHPHLSRWSESFGHDLVNIATYTGVILDWLEPKRITDSRSVVVVGGMVEAFVVATRSACDSAASALGYIASRKPGQAPESLRGLVRWSEKHPNRVLERAATVLGSDFSWFWELRSLRDHLVHNGCHANIHCDGRQFNLWVHSNENGWLVRRPLLPWLRDCLAALLDFGNRVGDAIHEELRLPADRRQSRVVAGVLVPALHQLRRIADQYAEPSS